jgi:hypothetical protein
LKPGDFHEISKKFMPNKAATDRMGEAAGIQFIRDACQVDTETRDDPICGKRTVFVARAQGRKRMPDGSWQVSTIDEYEFDPVLRAMLDKNVTELNEITRKNIARAIMEYSKIGRQRAATGARLRVIRQLTGMPPSFERADISKPFLFTRIVQNTGYILQTQEGRAMATAQALGVDVGSLFGGSKAALPEAEGAEYTDVTPEVETEEAEGKQESVFDAPPNQMEPDFDSLTQSLTEYLEGYEAELCVDLKNGLNPYKVAEAELTNPDATVGTRLSTINRIREFLIKSGYSV